MIKHSDLIYIFRIVPVLFLMTLYVLTLSGCEADKKENHKRITEQDSTNENKKSTVIQKTKYTLSDFYSDDKGLEYKTDSVFNALTPKERVSQMIIACGGSSGKSNKEIVALIRNRKLGGLLVMGGSKEQYKALIDDCRSTAQNSGSLPLIFSADAEPSLINLKISGLEKFPQTSSIKTSEQSEETALKITNVLKQIGINQNFAPVCDLSLNREIIGNRSYGSNTTKVERLAAAFSISTQKNEVIATAKHFPGHGNVNGDSHNELVYIDGELKELEVFEHLIKSGVISVMVGHIAIRNNPEYSTDGLPSTLSEKIVTGLLKKKLGFKGLVVTDAMNMKAVSVFGSPSLKAIEAGCDMILMPSNEEKLISAVISQISNNKLFEASVYASVRKIIRVKICLGLL